MASNNNCALQTDVEATSVIVSESMMEGATLKPKSEQETRRDLCDFMGFIETWKEYKAKNSSFGNNEILTIEQGNDTLVVPVVALFEGARCLIQSKDKVLPQENDLTTVIENYASQVSTLTAENNAMKLVIAKTNIAHAKLSSTNQELMNLKSFLTDEKATLIKSHQETTSRLNVENITLRAKNELYVSEILELSQKLIQMEEIKNSHANCSKESEKLIETVKESQREIASLKETNAKFSEAYTARSKKSEKITEDLKAAQQEIASLKETNAKLFDESEKIKEYRNKITEDLKAAQQEIASLKETNAKFSEALETATQAANNQLNVLQQIQDLCARYASTEEEETLPPLEPVD